MQQQRPFDDEDFDDGEALDEEPYFDDEPDLGPDERDADLMDGSWETRYYTRPAPRRDWGAIQVGIGLLLVMALLIPLILAVTP